MARKKKSEEVSEVETENVTIDAEVEEEKSDQTYLTCTVKNRQFVSKGVVIRHGERALIDKPFSPELKLRIKEGFIKEVN